MLDVLSSTFGFEYTIEESAHETFIEGRVGRVIVKGKKVGYIGDIHPGVLLKFDVQMPVAAMELNLTDLFEVMNKGSGNKKE